MITEAVYRANGVPGSGYRRSRSSRTHLDGDGAGDRRAATLAKPKRITSGEFGAGNHRWSTDGREIYFVSDRRRESYYFPSDSDLYAVPPRRRRAGARRQHRRHYRRVRALARRQAYRVRRHASRRAGALVQPARSLGRRPAGGTPRNLTASVRLRHQRRHRRRSARAARPASRRPGLEPRRPRHPDPRRRAGQCESVRVDAATGRVDRRHQGQPRRHVVHDRRDRQPHRVRAVDRRPSSATCTSLDVGTRRPEEAHDVQRRAVQPAAR